MRVTIILIGLLVGMIIHAQPKGFSAIVDTKVVEDKLNSNASATNTIVSDFVQEKRLEYLDETIISKGKFWFKKENMLRWEYTVPFKYMIVISNGKFIIKDEEKTSVYDINSNKAFQEINKLIISSVRGTLMSDNRFNINLYQDNTYYLVKLTPKDAAMAKIINNTEVYFDKKDLSVCKVIMIENAKDFTIITFTNKKLNETVADTIFVVQ